MLLKSSVNNNNSPNVVTPNFDIVTLLTDQSIHISQTNM